MVPLVFMDFTWGMMAVLETIVLSGTLLCDALTGKKIPVSAERDPGAIKGCRNDGSKKTGL